MISPQTSSKHPKALFRIGLVIFICISLAAIISLVDPFKQGINEKHLALSRPNATITPTLTPFPTSDPCANQEDALIPGCPVPNFLLATFDGQSVSLAKLTGKVVVINFWASWCLPCREEAAALQKAWLETWTRGDIIFIGIAWTDTDQDARDFIQQYRLTYPTGTDFQNRIARSYHIAGVPETYIADKDGKLAFKKAGPFTSVDEIRQAINPLLEP